MRPEEYVETGRLAGSALRGATGIVRDSHASIASSVFAVVRRAMGPELGRAVAPVELAHLGISRGVYAATGLALDHAARAAGYVAGRKAPEHPPGPLGSITDHPHVNPLLGIVQGFHGDKMLSEASPLAYPMTLRRSGYDVPLTTGGLAEAYPDARPQVVVFVHGWTGTEQMWRKRGLSYGRQLEAAGDWSALWVRYNTGRRISDNGRDLRDLLRRVHARWPVRPTRIALVGHSMGGLVLHSALVQADLDEPWVESATDLITLGTPHHGSPVERGANALAGRLAPHRSTAWIADLIKFRADGVRDLRHGNLVMADWDGHDPDSIEDLRTHARHGLESLRHLAVVAAIGPTETSRRSRWFGDLLVGQDSATGWAGDDLVWLGSMNHIDLLNHPRVYRHIVRRLGEEPPASLTSEVG